MKCGWEPGELTAKPNIITVADQYQCGPRQTPPSPGRHGLRRLRLHAHQSPHPELELAAGAAPGNVAIAVAISLPLPLPKKKPAFT